MKKKNNRQLRSSSRKTRPDIWHEGRQDMELDIDRMVNEGLGGGYVEPGVNGTIDESTPEEQVKE